MPRRLALGVAGAHPAVFLVVLAAASLGAVGASAREWNLLSLGLAVAAFELLLLWFLAIWVIAALAMGRRPLLPDWPIYGAMVLLRRWLHKDRLGSVIAVSDGAPARGLPGITSRPGSGVTLLLGLGSSPPPAPRGAVEMDERDKMSFVRWMMAAITLILFLGILFAQATELITDRWTAVWLGALTITAVFAGFIEARRRRACVRAVSSALPYTPGRTDN
jgi:quinol-cytochrome oxidoreductase complex cytochrome b subunit